MYPCVSGIYYFASASYFMNFFQNAIRIYFISNMEICTLPFRFCIAHINTLILMLHPRLMAQIDINMYFHTNTNAMPLPSFNDTNLAKSVTVE